MPPWLYPRGTISVRVDPHDKIKMDYLKGGRLLKSSAGTGPPIWGMRPVPTDFYLLHRHRLHLHAPKLINDIALSG